MLIINKISYILYQMLEKIELKNKQLLNQKIIENKKKFFKIINKVIYLA